jgi:long-chain acyl-CoA synthetase
MGLLETIATGPTRDHPALVYGEHQLTFGELISAGHTRANWLRKNGVSKGSVVSTVLEDPLQFIIWQLASIEAKVVFAPVSPQFTSWEFQDVLRTLEPQWLITDIPIPPTHCQPVQSLSVFGVHLQRYYKFRTIPSELSEGGFIRFSSGTTGVAKGVCISFQSAFDRVQAVLPQELVQSGDKVLSVLSLHHHFVISVLLFLTSHTTLILPKNQSPREFLDAIKLHDPQVVYGAPFHVQLLANRSALSGTTIRQIITTSTALSEKIAQDFYSHHDIPLIQILGNIEVGLPLINQKWARTMPTALGSLLPAFNAQLKPVTGLVTHTSDLCGELFLKGPGLFDCYLDPYRHRTTVSSAEGFSTGDIVSVDRNGCYHFLGRNKSVMNIGGLKVLPEEVEQELCSLPEVKEALVYSVPHDIFGERIIAEVIATNLNERSVRQHLRQRLSRYKIPSEIIFKTELMRTTTGKIIRR